MRLRDLALLMPFLLSAAPAAAQNATLPGALELYPTLQSVGVRLAYTGDDNANATARLEWRPQGGTSWNAGVTMTRITNLRWAGSVMWLAPDTPYEVRAVVEDPDGGGAVAGFVRTRPEPPTTATGRAWWVATSGSDSAAGTSTTPLRTLQAAADRAQPGDEIRVRPGTYYQTVAVPRSGSAGAYLHLVADALGVILDGSDPAMLSRADWRDDGGGVFSVPFAGVTRLVCADSLQRLYHQANLAALQSSANGVAQGWTVESGRLWVKLEDGSSPVGHLMHVARYDVGVYIEASFWRVAGFEVRYFGTSSAAGGISLRAANSCVVSGNYVHTIGGRAIFLRAQASDNLVERNLVIDPRISTWPWSAVKSHEEESSGILQRGNRGNVVRTNTVRGTFDGIDFGGGDPADEDVSADNDFHDNVITGVGDDGIETDLLTGINLRLWHNHFDRCYSGISVAPNTVGPEYILYNTVTNTTRGGFKFSLSGTGETWICHNTVVSDQPSCSAVHPSGPYSNIHFRNNVLVGNGAGAVGDDTGESVTGNDYDGDLVFSNSTVLFRWKGVNYSNLAALRSGTGFELNGRAGDPLFVSPPTGDYRLGPGSPAIDAGLRLPGINDAFLGAAPDAGAFESGNDPDRIPPASITDLH